MKKFLHTFSIPIIVLSFVSVMCSYGSILLFEYLESFRFQILITAFLLFIFSVFQKEKYLIIGLFLSVIIHIYVFYNGEKNISFSIEKKQNFTSKNNFTDNFSVLSFNIWKNNPHQIDVLKLVNNFNPDIIWLQEIKINFYHQIYSELAKKYPFSFPEKNKVSVQGNILLSKFPFDIKPIKSELKNSFVHAEMLLGKNKKIDFFGVHLCSPRSQSDLEKRYQQFVDIAKYIHRQNGVPHSRILAGDMNSVYWNSAFKKFREKTYFNHHRNIYNRLPTWPSYLPELFQIPLDYVMTSPDICLETSVKAPATGSDHYPIFYNLYFCD